MRPKAQTMASAHGVSRRSCFAAKFPMATPENPARQVIMPNMKLTLNIHTSYLLHLPTTKQYGQ